VVVYTRWPGEDRPDMIAYLSRVAEACEAQGMPLMRSHAPTPTRAWVDGRSLGVDYLKRNARLCAELGADIVKVNWSGDQASFGEIVRACGRPVVLAGGSRISDEELLARMELARQVGAVGCSVGRNVFQHPHPQAITAALSHIFRDQWTAKQAVDELIEKMSR
jgi:DhnA family fructose-bisphosphate aldolase class Ia